MFNSCTIRLAPCSPIPVSAPALSPPFAPATIFSPYLKPVPNIGTPFATFLKNSPADLDLKIALPLKDIILNTSFMLSLKVVAPIFAALASVSACFTLPATLPAADNVSADSFAYLKAPVPTSCTKSPTLAIPFRPIDFIPCLAAVFIACRPVNLAAVAINEPPPTPPESAVNAASNTSSVPNAPTVPNANPALPINSDTERLDMISSSSEGSTKTKFFIDSLYSAQFNSCISAASGIIFSQSQLNNASAILP